MNRRTRFEVAALAFIVTGGGIASAAAAGSSQGGTSGAASGPSGSAAPPTTLPATAMSFGSAFYEARKARCATAVCWGGDGYRYAFEPLLELPIGKTFAITGTQNSLGMFIDGHDFTVTFAAGLRFWAFDDLLSIGVYLSQPLLTGDSTIQVRNSPVAQPVSNIRRPYPGLTIGLFGDLLWVGLDYQRLVNGDGSTRDPDYPASYKLAEAWSMTIGLAPGTGLRSGVATGLKSSPAGGSSSGAAGSGSSAPLGSSSGAPAGAPPAASSSASGTDVSPGASSATPPAPSATASATSTWTPTP